MRSEAEMYKLLINIADTDDRILAVYMNGSRTNKNAARAFLERVRCLPKNAGADDCI